MEKKTKILLIVVAIVTAIGWPILDPPLWLMSTESLRKREQSLEISQGWDELAGRKWSDEYNHRQHDIYDIKLELARRGVK